MDVNPFSAVTWSWRALRGHSVTFAGLFACGILGLSLLSRFRHLLADVGAPWLVWFIAPIVLVAVIARKEATWLPEPDRRRKWARRIFFGSIVLAVALAYFRPEPPPKPVEPVTAPRRSEWKK